MYKQILWWTDRMKTIFLPQKRGSIMNNNCNKTNNCKKIMFTLLQYNKHFNLIAQQEIMHTSLQMFQFSLYISYKKIYPEVNSCMIYYCKFVNNKSWIKWTFTYINYKFKILKMLKIHKLNTKHNLVYCS